MIIMELMGGLGNQMFQYAAGRGIAARAGLDLKLDASAYATPGNRAYRLDQFNIRAPLATSDEIHRLKPRHKLTATWLRYRLARVLMPLHRRPVIVERTQSFDPSLFAIETSAYLSGFWQSEHYFADITDQIRKELTPREPPSGPNARMLDQMIDKTSVSIHIRRGDYVADPKVTLHHGILGLDYYSRAIAYIAARVEAPWFYVFSDDIHWVRAHLVNGFPTIYVDHNNEEHDYEDLRLMSLCNHHIIANSSFSWWGAWLRSSPEKVVIAPQRWFADIAVDESSRYPNGWIKL